MGEKRTYYPARTFDDDLDSFGGLMKENGWTSFGITAEQLEQDAIAQRAQRAEHDALEAKWQAAHEAFGQAQEERYERFAAALGAARAAFRKDKSVMAALARYKRSMRPTKKPKAP